MMTMIYLFKSCIQLAFKLSGYTRAEYPGYFVRHHEPQAYFTGPFEYPVDGEISFEYEIAAIFDLTYGIEPSKVHGTSFFERELWS